MSSDLVAYAATRDSALRGRLAVRHLPLVKFVARKMTASLPRHIDLDDLVSWGTIGLFDAIDKFDPHREVRFSTYAVIRIRGAILDGLQQMSWAPKQVTSRVHNVRRAQEVLTNELGMVPTSVQLAVHLGVTEAEVNAWLLDDRTTQVKALVAGGDVDGSTFTGSMEPSVAAEQELAGEVAELRGFLAAAVRCLTAREQAVFLLYYRDSLTLREVADALGVSVSSATQTHTRLVSEIRERLAHLGGAA